MAIKKEVAYYYCPALKKKYYVGKTKVLVKTEKNVLDERVVKYEEKILTQEYVDEMLSRKKIVPIYTKTSIPTDISYYNKLLMDEYNFNTTEELQSFLFRVEEINPIALIVIYLKTIAKEIDRLCYESSISDCQSIYYFSLKDTAIRTTSNMNHALPSFKYLPAFRTFDDALTAMHILTNLFKTAYTK